MKFLKFGMILALIFAGISCEKEENQEVVPSDGQLEMKDVAFSRWEHGNVYDTFRFVLATGATEIDPDQGVLLTKDDGYVMYCNLFTKPVTDTATPVIPDGTYKTGENESPNVWFLDNRMNFFISKTKSDGVKIDHIKQGTLRVSHSGNEYTIKAEFTTAEGETLKVQYKGAIQFEGLVDDGTKLVEPVNTRFIGGQACYLGADPDFSHLGLVRLELYDAEPDPELGTVYGNMVKSLLYINKPIGNFTILQEGTYTVGLGAVAFVAKPGEDDGVNIPTGTFIAQTASKDSQMRLSMINSGTIEVTKEGYVTIDLKTTDGVSVCGKLRQALEISDLSGQGGGGEPQEPEGPLSALKTDKVIDLSDVDTGYLYEYGDVYHNNTRNIVIQVLSEVTHRGFLLDLALPQATKGSPLAEGTYKVADASNPAYTFAPGRILGPNAIGTWPYVELYNQDKYTLVDFKTSGNAVDGTLDIKHEGDGVYTLTFNFLDDAETPHKITGSWTGKFQDESYVSPFVHNLLHK